MSLTCDSLANSYKSQVTLGLVILLLKLNFKRMTSKDKNDGVLLTSFVLSVVGLVLLIGVTWYFQLSLNSKQQQVEYDRVLLLQLQEQLMVKVRDQ